MVIAVLHEINMAVRYCEHLVALALSPWLSALPRPRSRRQRIIALEWLPTELLLALGAAPLAVADTRNYNIWVGKPPLPSHKVDFGLCTEPNLKLMTQLQPSLILCSNGCGPSPEKLRGIAPIMGFDLNRGDGKPLSAARDSLRALATLISQEAEAEAHLQMLALYARASDPADVADGQPPRARLW